MGRPPLALWVGLVGSVSHTHVLGAWPTQIRSHSGYKGKWALFYHMKVQKSPSITLFIVGAWRSKHQDEPRTSHLAPRTGSVCQ